MKSFLRLDFVNQLTIVLHFDGYFIVISLSLQLLHCLFILLCFGLTSVLAGEGIFVFVSY